MGVVQPMSIECSELHNDSTLLSTLFPPTVSYINLHHKYSVCLIYYHIIFHFVAVYSMFVCDCVRELARAGRSI